MAIELIMAVVVVVSAHKSDVLVRRWRKQGRERPFILEKSSGKTGYNICFLCFWGGKVLESKGKK